MFLLGPSAALFGYENVLFFFSILSGIGKFLRQELPDEILLMERGLSCLRADYIASDRSLQC